MRKVEVGDRFVDIKSKRTLTVIGTTLYGYHIRDTKSDGRWLGMFPEVYNEWVDSVLQGRNPYWKHEPAEEFKSEMLKEMI